jgi:rubrerythrin
VSRRGRSGVMDIYPSEYATTRKYPTLSGSQLVPAENVEPGAIKCAQCGLPIEDHRAIATCPFCGSDNFLGRKFAKWHPPRRMRT